MGLFKTPKFQNDLGVTPTPTEAAPPPPTPSVPIATQIAGRRNAIKKGLGGTFLTSGSPPLAAPTQQTGKTLLGG